MLWECHYQSSPSTHVLVLVIVQAGEGNEQEEEEEEEEKGNAQIMASAASQPPSQPLVSRLVSYFTFK